MCPTPTAAGDTHAAAAADARVRSELLDYFKPEFINRLDDIVRFKALTREQISEIVELQVDLVIARVAERLDSWVIPGAVTTRRGAVLAEDVEVGDRVACWSDGHLAWRSVVATVAQAPRPAMRIRTRHRDLIVPRDWSLLRLRRTPGVVRMGSRPWESGWAAIGELDRGDPIVLVDERALEESAPEVSAVGYRGVLGALPDSRFAAERVLAVQPAGLLALTELELDGTDNYISDGAVVARAPR